jgi:large repetitive protein
MGIKVDNRQRLSVGRINFIVLLLVKNTIRFLLTATLLFFALTTFAQRGRIITPATPLTNPMNPNGDTWITASGAEFSNDGYNVDEFEFRMFGIPKLGGDVAGDNIGQPCGITDLIPDRDGYSVYAHRDANNNIIFRFRVGSNNPSVEAWTILLDIDNKFGASDPNATTNNPGFEVDITLIKRNNAGVLVYNIDGIESCPQPIKNYPISSHFQIAIADTRACNDADYFYDFYVPFEEIAAIFRGLGFDLEPTTGMRYVAVTNVSATCAMAGKIADISGVDYDDYSKNVPGAFTALVEAQCPTAVLDLCETCEGFDTGLLKKPTIETPIRAGQTFVKGTSLPDTYIRLSIFSRIGGTDENPIWSLTPREEKTVLVPASGEWTVNLDGPLLAYDRIVARALKTEDGSGCGDSSGNETSTSITVVDPNVAPVAQDLAITTPEDTPIQFSLTATDADNDPITYIIVTQPANGTVTLIGTGPQVIYTPNLNYFGSDSFTYRASDGVLLSNIATVTITVTPVNDPPVANDNAFTTNEDTPLSANVSTNDSDVDGPLALYTVVTQPSNGTLILNTDGTFTYTPNPDYNGTDQFVYQRCDGGEPNLCDQATVTITILPVNDPPIANDDSFIIDEDTQLIGTVASNDNPTDGPQAIYTIAVQPLHGTLVLSGNGNFTYTPNQDYFGQDQFTYNLCDGALIPLCDQAVVTITINPVNDPPIANDDSFSTDENVAIIGASVAGNDSDVDGPEALYSLVSGPSNGTLVFNANGTFNYTPNLNFNGTDQFTYRLCDNGTPNLCDDALVTITVNSTNEPPVANDDVFVTDEDVPLNGNVSDNDDFTDGPDAVYSVVNNPSNGTLVLNANGTFTYTPDPNWSGIDQFTYRLCDQGDPNLCDDATVTITVNPINDPPVITGAVIPTQYAAGGVLVDNTLLVTDVDDLTIVSVIATISNNFIAGDQLIFVNQSGITGSYNAATGVLSLTGTATLAAYTDALRSIVFQNDDGISFATRRITFVANDGQLNSLPWNSFIDYPGNNGDPVLNNDQFSTPEDTPLITCLDVSDPDGDAVVISAFGNTPNGSFTFSGNDACFTFTPALNFNGVINTTVRICDVVNFPDEPRCVIVPITITVTPVNDAPVALNQNVTVIEDTPKEIILTATDVDNDLSDLTFTILSQPQFGSLTGSGRNWTYTPNPDYTGPDSFTFRVNDGELNSNIATIFINVIPENDPPVALDQVVTVIEDTPKVITLTATDIDTPQGDLVYTIVTFPQHGTLIGSGNTWTYTPDPDYNGPDSFTFKVNDGEFDSNIATVTINVVPVNDPPVVISQIIEIDEDNSVTVCIQYTDAEGDPAFISSLIPQNNTGTIVLDPAAGELCFTFTPNPNFNGTEIIDIIICDPLEPSVCGSGTVTIIVKPVNDPPVIVVGGVPVDTLFVSTIEDVPVDFCFDAEDIEGDLLSFGTATNIQGGGTMVYDPNSEFCFTFTPAENFFGRAIWEITICDNGTPSLCGKVIIVIDVDPVDDPPVAFDQIVEVIEDTPKEIILQASDPDNDPLTYTVLTQPAHGVLTGIAPNLTYSPAQDYNGPDAFTFRVNDGTSNSNIATVTINVIPVNDPPVLTILPVLFTKEDSVLQVCPGVVDVDGDPITYLPATNSKGGGTMPVDDPPFNFCYLFTPPLNYNGESIWQISVSDGTVTVSAPVKIIVLPVNDPPVALNDFYTVRSGIDTVFNALDNDLPIVAPFKEFYDIYEADSVDVLRVTEIEAGPYHGTLTFQSDGRMNYRSNFGYQGADSVRYKMCDSGNLCETAVVFITVTPAPFKVWQALSPNGDGLNDYWRIDGIEAYPNNKVQVFDRYGNLVFETRGYLNADSPGSNGSSNNYWRGQANKGLIGGSLPDGTYFYAIDLGNGTPVLSGYVVLKLN